MANVMCININADEDIQYTLKGISKSDTGVYNFISDNRKSLINIACKMIDDISNTMHTNNKSFDLEKIKALLSEVYRDITSDCDTDDYSYELNYDDFSISLKISSIRVFFVDANVIQIKEE